MGGTTFETHNDLDDVAQAYSAAVADAAWEHGHGGYTGTIAEKSGYVVFDVPAGKTAKEAMDALQRAHFDYATDSWVKPDWLPQQILETYDDKWGPAVAVKADDQPGWHFLGWASC